MLNRYNNITILEILLYLSFFGVSNRFDILGKNKKKPMLTASINTHNSINIINNAKNALKMKNSDTFYRIRIVLLTWRSRRDSNSCTS